MRKCVNGGLVVEKSSLFGFRDPLVGISVAVEDYLLVFLYGLSDKLVERLCKVFCVFKFVRKLLELFRNYCVEYDVGI